MSTNESLALITSLESKMDMERLESRDDQQERGRDDDVDDRRDRDPPVDPPIDEIKEVLTEYKVCKGRKD